MLGENMEKWHDDVLRQGAMSTNREIYDLGLSDGEKIGEAIGEKIGERNMKRIVFSLITKHHYSLEDLKMFLSQE